MSNRCLKKINRDKAAEAESTFKKYCKNHNIKYIKLDDSDKKSRFLIDPNKKSPDFYCEKNGKKIFVEVKTLTVFINSKVEKMTRRNAKKTNNECRGLINLPKELQKPMKTFWASAKEQFKNLKPEYNYPRILLLNGLYGNADSYIHSTFSFVDKKEPSNISTIVYWNEETNCYKYLKNSNPKIPFPESDFHLFFG